MRISFLSLPLLITALSGCGVVDNLNNTINESTYSIQANREAIENSTQSIRYNTQTIQESNRAIAENRNLIETELKK